MNISQLRARWQDEAFLRSTASALSNLASQRAGRGLDLRGLLFGSEGTPAILQNTNLVGVELTSTDFSYSRIEVAVSEARFSGVNFNDSTFSRVIAARAVFQCCTFDRAKLQLSANDATFEECSFIGSAFGSPRALQEWGGRRARFLHCNFDGANLRGVEFRAALFEECSFVGALFSKCDLRGTKFIGDEPEVHECIV